jgi:hypothetical protein
MSLELDYNFLHDCNTDCCGFFFFFCRVRRKILQKFCWPVPFTKTKPKFSNNSRLDFGAFNGCSRLGSDKITTAFGEREWRNGEKNDGFGKKNGYLFIWMMGERILI